MQRLVLKDMTLKDGTYLPKGTLMEIYAGRMWDPKLMEDADKFNPYRWLKLREQPGMNGLAQHVMPSPDFPVWGYGTWACPGRFFANNEVKMVLCHILLKYNLKFSEKHESTIFNYTMNRLPKPGVKLLVRHREPEIDIDSLRK
jgi:cytochrome P450